MSVCRIFCTGVGNVHIPWFPYFEHIVAQEWEDLLEHIVAQQ